MICFISIVFSRDAYMDRGSIAYSKRTLKVTLGISSESGEEMYEYGDLPNLCNINTRCLSNE